MPCPSGRPNATSPTGYVNPDEKTFAYLKGRTYSPKGAVWDAAVEK